MKRIFRLTLWILFLGLIVFAIPVRGEIQNLSVATLDGFGQPSSSFSVGGRIGLSISCYNSADVDRVYFEFHIFDPGGKEVFRHLGNSSPGNAGNKTSSVTSVPLSFYNNPGYYTFKGKVLAGAFSQEKEATFRIIPGFIELNYPPNGIKDLADDPLTFRWYCSGADRYRIYLDDNSGFLNPIWTAETNEANIQYPSNPTDPRQKLSSGVEYWWKVDGLDVAGNKIMSTRTPYSFTIKTVAAVVSDVAVEKLDFLPDDEKEEASIIVYVKNRGGRGEYNIPVMAYLNGEQVGSPKNIELLEIGETKKVLFDCSEKAKKLFKDTRKEEISIVISGMIDFSDNNLNNNILTAEIKCRFGKAKILGRVTDNDSPPRGAGDVTIVYSGPVSGEVKTNPGGNYVIDNLLPGEYTIKAVKEGCEPSSEKVVKIEKRKAYTGNDFTLVTLAKPIEVVLQIDSPEVVQEKDIVIIRVKIKDSKGVDKVEVHYQLPGEKEVKVLQMKRISGDEREGVYEATIKQ